MPFLKAQWRKLAIANYAIDSHVLKSLLPFGTEFDLWEGKCYISLVGFMFLDTKLLGVKIPFHINFEEANLRFYVKRMEGEECKRGVVFVREIVPKHAIAFVANYVYKEHYERLKMRHAWQEENEVLHVSYEWKKKGKWHTFHVTADNTASKIAHNSEVEFITEHYWGYAKAGATKTIEYEVTHPVWEHYPVHNFNIDIDFGTVYGQEFAFLNRLQPDSVMLAEGSEITVERRRKIKK